MTLGPGRPALESLLEQKQQWGVWEGVAPAGWGPEVREDPMSRAQWERTLQWGLWSVQSLWENTRVFRVGSASLGVPDLKGRD